MNIVRRLYPLIFLFLSLIAVSNLLIPPDDCKAASQRTLAWSMVDTPSDNINGMFIRKCGINDLALGPDNRTFYAVSTDNTIDNTTLNTGLFKSIDAGYSWSSHIGVNLARDSGVVPPVWFPPVWNIAIAPDDANYIIAVTDNSSAAASSGPTRAYGSIDGGNNWTPLIDLNKLPTGILMIPDEYVSCLDISNSNSGNRDIVIGTRSIGGSGRLLTMRYNTSFSVGWADQPLPAVPPAVTTAVTSVKFSPNYISDQTMAVISFTAVGPAPGAYLHLGKHDSTGNTTTWDNMGAGYTGYPVPLGNTLLPPIVYLASNIVRTGIQLPSDYTARPTDMSLSGCFVNVDDITKPRVFYISPIATIYNITPTGRNIYSIAYSGSNTTGILLAGEATVDNATKALGNVWQCLNAQASTPGAATWLKSDPLKSPTGGGGTGRANVLLAWNPDGNTAYCGTSSEDSTLGGTGWAAGQWPFSKLTKALSDESAFQYSMNNGAIWNQTGIINTVISQLADVAAYEQPEGEDSGTLYLASINGDNITDSVWRSTSNPLGHTWERVLTWPTSKNGIILRINPRDKCSRTAIVFADLTTTTVIHSPDEGNLWTQLLPGMVVNDISLLDDTTMYVLGDYTVRRLPVSGQPGRPLNTNLLAPGHTICTPLTPSPNSSGKAQELVIIGTGGNEDCYVAWADFAEPVPKFTPLKKLPVQGDVHVVTDDRYDSNKTIYAGITTSTHDDGNIYRWTTGTSTNWDELDPINRSFFGLCMLNDVLYGAWNTDITPPVNDSGADRTLDARAKVPPPPEWDELCDGLLDPPPGPVFACEPTSLHASSNAYNTLWAIDHPPPPGIAPYNFIGKTGCLWSYIDSVAKLGPWPTAPPPGGLIGPDPVTGRAHQIDFRWRPLRDVFGYDLLIAKDVNFTLLLGRQVPIMTPADNITSTWIIAPPVDNLTGAWVVQPADQENPACWISPGILEAGRPYYWKVRGSRSVFHLGSENWTRIHSPWSPTMFFSVKPGFRVTADYMGPTLLTPVDGMCGNCKPPIRFSWGAVEGAKKYEFVLANDAQFSDVIVRVITQSTAYEYEGKLKLAKPYFWQVRAYAPAPGDRSPVGTFTLSENMTTPQNTLLSTINSFAFPALSSLWTWIIILIIAVLLFVILTYIFISRRRY
jgi:hypothetical protein